MKLPVSGVRIDNPAFPLLQALISYWGITSGVGAATGLTVVCADLVNQPTYLGQRVKLLDGAAAGQDRVIMISAAGTLTVDDPFTNAAGAAIAVTAGTRFVIITRPGAGGGPAPPTGPSQALSFYGDVTTWTNANTFVSTDLAGFGDGFFIGYNIYVVRDLAGVGGAPQGEFQLCTGYTSAAGTFTHAAFTVNLAVGDSVILIHPAIWAAMVALYDGTVYFNDTDGVAGTVFPVGTSMMPSNDEASTRTLAMALGLRKINVYTTVAGGFVVPGAMEGYEFIGHGQYSAMDTIDFNGQDVDASVFRRLNIIGAQGGTGPVTLDDCILVNPTGLRAMMRNCFIQQATLAAGAVIDGLNCAAFQGAATITLGTPNPCNLYGWKGDLVLASQTGGETNIYSLGGSITINITCNGGTINIYGRARVDDGSAAGCTVHNYASLRSVYDVYNLPNDVAENTVFTIDYQSLPAKINSIFLDMSNLVQNVIIRIKVQIDGINFRTIETFNWTVGMDDGVYFREITVDMDVRVTIQSVIAQGGVMGIPYLYVEELQ